MQRHRPEHHHHHHHHHHQCLSACNQRNHSKHFTRQKSSVVTVLSIRQHQSNGDCLEEKKMSDVFMCEQQCQLFADYAKILTTMSSGVDIVNLQQALDRISGWSAK